MEALFTPELLMSFITLSLLEIVLGIDNLIFIALVVQHLPQRFRRSARLIGLSLALIIRIVMLMAVSWIMSLTKPVFTILIDFSIKDILLLVGGMFLIIKGGMEIYSDLRVQKESKEVKAAQNFLGAIAQIAFIDFIFSFDSIITAVGVTGNITGVVDIMGWEMKINILIITAAVVVSMIVMLLTSGYLAEFLAKYPSFKVMGIAFIILIGILLVVEGFHGHIDREYIYFALVFSIGVEILNTLHRKRHQLNLNH